MGETIDLSYTFELDPQATCVDSDIVITGQTYYDNNNPYASNFFSTASGVSGTVTATPLTNDVAGDFEFNIEAGVQALASF